MNSIQANKLAKIFEFMEQEGCEMILIDDVTDGIDVTKIKLRFVIPRNEQ